MLNARRIHDELNIFEGLKKSYMFIFIWFMVLFLQVLMVMVGSYAFSCHLEGLTWEQWLICIGFGMLPVPWRLVLRLIPDGVFKEYGQKEHDISKDGHGALIIRRSSNELQRRHSSFNPR